MNLLGIAFTAAVVTAAVVYCLLKRLIRFNRRRHLEFLLDSLTILLERYGVEYWLDFGTLLGVFRSGQVIPYDYDVDVSVHADHQGKVEKLIQELPEGFSVKRFRKDVFYKIIHVDHRCSFDIYFCHDLPNGELGHSFSCIVHEGEVECVPYQMYGSFARDLIFPLKKIRWQFEGGERQLDSPAGSHEYLKTLYSHPSSVTHRAFFRERLFIKKSFRARRWTFE